jgi:hypothetical protein
MPQEGLSGYCRALVSQLDEFRSMWLGVLAWFLSFLDTTTTTTIGSRPLHASRVEWVAPAGSLDR